jgi:hypothetical protein
MEEAGASGYVSFLRGTGLEIFLVKALNRTGGSGKAS